jgi:predicted DNA-binding protein
MTLDVGFMSCRLHDMRTTGNAANDAVYTIRIEREKLARLHEIADAHNRTLAGQIRTVLEREIAEHDIDLERSAAA